MYYSIRKKVRSKHQIGEKKKGYYTKEIDDCDDVGAIEDVFSSHLKDGPGNSASPRLTAGIAFKRPDCRGSANNGTWPQAVVLAAARGTPAVALAAPDTWVLDLMDA
ncbi:UNVERIFIED_CONTAM: hypothetical protein FKN15_061734 [Acipenser sinensis]